MCVFFIALSLLSSPWYSLSSPGAPPERKKTSFFQQQINIFQYFDVTVMEEEIRSSVISYFLMDFAPKTLSIFIDFFPSLEVIVESSDQLKKIDV